MTRCCWFTPVRELFKLREESACLCAFARGWQSGLFFQERVRSLPSHVGGEGQVRDRVRIETFRGKLFFPTRIIHRGYPVEVHMPLAFANERVEAVVQE